MRQHGIAIDKGKEGAGGDAIVRMRMGRKEEKKGKLFRQLPFL
jgi:hypothetical protein